MKILHPVILAATVALAVTACKQADDAAPVMPAESQAPAAQTQTPAPAEPAPPVAVAVATVDVGTAIGADQTITTPSAQFAPADTIHVAVATTGAAPSATLAAKLVYQDGQVAGEHSQTIAPTGPASTSFEFAKPDGWPVGSYTLEVTLDGVPVDSSTLTVK